MLWRYDSEQTDLSEFLSSYGNAGMYLMFPCTPIGNVANLFTIFADIISNSTDTEISDEYTYMAHIPEPRQVKAKAVTFKLQQSMTKFNGNTVDSIFMPIIIRGVDESSKIAPAIATAYATDAFTIDYKLSSYVQNRSDEQTKAENPSLKQEKTISEVEDKQHTTDASVQPKPKPKYTHTKQYASTKAKQRQKMQEGKKKKATKKPTKQAHTKKWETFDANLPFNFKAWKKVTLDTDFSAAKQTEYASQEFSVDIKDSDTEETINQKITECLTKLESFIKEKTNGLLTKEYKKLVQEGEYSFRVAIKDIQANAPLEMLKVLYAALMYNLDALKQEESNEPGVITKCYSAVHNNFFDFTVEYSAFDLWPAFIKLDKYWYDRNALAQVLQSLYVRQLAKPNCEAGINYVAQKLCNKAITAGREKEFILIYNNATNMAKAEFKKLAEENKALMDNVSTQKNADLQQ